MNDNGESTMVRSESVLATVTYTTPVWVHPPASRHRHIDDKYDPIDLGLQGRISGGNLSTSFCDSFPRTPMSQRPWPMIDSRQRSSKASRAAN